MLNEDIFQLKKERNTNTVVVIKNICCIEKIIEI